MYLWAIYIFPRSVHLFSCSRLGRPTVGIYESLKETLMQELELRLRCFISGNICFEFSVQCLCSVLFAGANPSPVHLFLEVWHNLKKEFKESPLLLFCCTFVCIRTQVCCWLHCMVICQFATVFCFLTSDVHNVFSVLYSGKELFYWFYS